MSPCLPAPRRDEISLPSPCTLSEDSCANEQHQLDDVASCGAEGARVVIALLEARRAGLFARGSWGGNIVAGVIVGVVALPLAMAFAIASGARPEQGLYTAIIAGMAVSLFGGSRIQIAGPTGAFIVILSGITAKYGIDGLQTATLM